MPQAFGSDNKANDLKPMATVANSSLYWKFLSVPRRITCNIAYINMAGIYCGFKCGATFVECANDAPAVLSCVSALERTYTA